LRSVVKEVVYNSRFGDFIGRSEFISDQYRQRISVTKINACQGIYSSHADAARECSVGWDEPNLAEALGDGARRFVDANPPSADMGPPQVSTYAVLMWLNKLIKPGTRIIDVGGATGIVYWLYRRYFTLPEGVTWVVIDMPAVVEHGRSQTKTADQAQLMFQTEIGPTGPDDILMALGSLQYMAPSQFQLFVTAAAGCRTVIVNKIALVDKAEFWTVQYLGTSRATYWIANRAAFFAAFAAIGFKCVETWPVPEISVGIPFASAHTNPSISGAILMATRGHT
jgi:putative methyltransferase (TIGR04325 family)